MRQAFHIFKKDARQFRTEIAALLLLSALYVYTTVEPWAKLMRTAGLSSQYSGGYVFVSYSHMTPLFPFLVIAWFHLIARLIHAEALPGDRQFWLTRPYDRKSLWAAKTIFVLTFVNLPMLCAQAAVITLDGLPLIPYLPGLCWNQVLLTAVFIIPAGALAAMTATLIQFAASAVTVAAVAAAVSDILFLDKTSWGALKWLWDSVEVAAILAIALPILYLQFIRRKTAVSRTLAAAGMILGFVLLSQMPWSPLFAIQSSLGKALPSPPRLELDPLPSPGIRTGKNNGSIVLPIRVAGLPSGTVVACEAAEVTIETPSGSTWRSGIHPDNSSIPQTTGLCRVATYVDNPAFFQANRERNVRVHVALYLIIFGDEHSTAVPFGREPMTVPGLGQCAALMAVRCRTGFEWPPRLVIARESPSPNQRFSSALSYLPFPDELSFAPVLTWWTPASVNAAGDMTIATREPLAHVRSDFEIRDVRLGDLE